MVLERFAAALDEEHASAIGHYGSHPNQRRRWELPLHSSYDNGWAGAAGNRELPLWYAVH